MKNICFLLSFLPLMGFAQKQGNIWYFGNHAGVDFNTTPPSALLNGENDFPACCGWNEGCSSVSDSSGSLLFYTNGATIWNRQQSIMDNGNGLMGHASSTQSSIIVPKPHNQNHFYVFTTDAIENSSLNGLRYSLVDLCGDEGNGEVMATAKNILLTEGIAEKLACVQHENGTDYWVITQELNSNRYLTFLLTNSDIADTVISQVGSPQCNPVGQLKASPNGQLLANASLNEICADGINAGSCTILDFNPATGIISNERVFSATGNAYGAAFSADGLKLYISWLGPGPDRIVQYDLSAGSFDAIDASAVDVMPGITNANWRQMQLGPDGKIYISRAQKMYISAIEFPNNPGLACNYIDTMISLEGQYSSWGLPNFITGYAYSNTIPDCIVSGHENLEGEFRIAAFPNPFTDELIFSTGKSEPLRVALFNLHGQLILQQEFLKKINIPTCHIPSGVYIYELSNKGILIKRGKVIRQ